MLLERNLVDELAAFILELEAYGAYQQRARALRIAKHNSPLAHQGGKRAASRAVTGRTCSLPWASQSLQLSQELANNLNDLRQCRFVRIVLGRVQSEVSPAGAG